jgi:acetylornithine deacetylase/succinyl-diaminopimelate desuccinylase-like protein
VTHFLHYAQGKQAEIISLTSELAACESPSDSPAAVNRMVNLLIEKTADVASAKTFEPAKFGKTLRLEFELPGEGKQGQVLALGHADTVWPLGTVKTMPVNVAAGRLWGPGVLDMKSGLAFFVFAMRALRDLNVAVKHNVVLLVAPDEEVGSLSSRAITEDEAGNRVCGQAEDRAQRRRRLSGFCQRQGGACGRGFHERRERDCRSGPADFRDREIHRPGARHHGKSGCD